MPYLKKQGCYINLRGVISVITQLTWYIYIGARLLELEVSIKYIGRYTKKPVIAETRIISCTEKWVIFMFKDYNERGRTKNKTMRLFTFITYLNVSEFTHPPCEIKSKTLLRSSISQGKFMRSPR